MQSVLIFILFLNSYLLSAQDIKVPLTFRVDTSNAEIRAVYNHWCGYLNSKPDSVYNNPFWDEEEIKMILKNHPKQGFDFTSRLMFTVVTAKQFMKNEKPSILSINKKNDSLFVIRTIFILDTLNAIAREETPWFITRAYCKKTKKGLRLVNALPYETAHWKTYKYDGLTYIVNPEHKFDKHKAKLAAKYCKNICKKFNLKTSIPISYYIASGEEELGKILGFDYWLSYGKGLTYLPLKMIFVVSERGEYHKHEFIHALFPAEHTGKQRPYIINEGLPTYLGGPDGITDFDAALKTFANEIKNKKELTLNDIITRNYYHLYDSTPLYVTGGLICKLVYEKHGLEGLNLLWQSDENKKEFESLIEKLFEMPYKQFDMEIIKMLQKYAD